ncbi:hypothetical protein CE91St26_20110 [Akkermansia muciniphila]|nr:hypothetical protein CE91St26_20110 [Akkermansia muciniphila]GKI09932.1 hypothetical protein CE91St27_20140 [Akkermansia muciniphila]
MPEKRRRRLYEGTYFGRSVGFPLGDILVKPFKEKVGAVGKSCVMACNDVSQHIAVGCFGGAPMGAGVFCSGSGMVYFFARMLFHSF